MLCHDCGRIEAELLTPEPPDKPEIIQQRLQGILPSGMSIEDCNKAHRQMQLKASYDALQLSAMNGCKCCRFFVEQIGQDSSRSREVLTGEERRRILRSSNTAALSLHRLRQPQKLREYFASGDRLSLTIENAESPLAEFDIVTTDLVDSARPYVTRRVIADHAANDECCAWIKARLQDCQQNHPKCAIIREIGVPKRLLNLKIPSNADSVRLETWNHESNPDVHCAALSHCWGPPSLGPTTTTKANLAAREKLIAVSDLSNNIRDAISVTRSLGIRYLGVDALCIIQQDESDWATQSKQMASIYRQAILTIVASCAANSTTGFLHYRARDTSLPVQAISISVALQPFRSYPTVDESLKNHWRQPIQGRAWTLQERLFSPRAIFYNSSQVTWECESRLYFESSTLDMSLLPVQRLYSPNFNYNDIFATLRVLEGSRFKEPNESLTSKEKDYYRWYIILAEFKRRKLTYAADALPAMLGFAQQFCIKLKDRYLAGIWQNDMCRSLSWYRYVDHERGKAITQPQPISEIFAPSWSWASVPEECSGTAWTDAMTLLSLPISATFGRLK